MELGLLRVLLLLEVYAGMYSPGALAATLARHAVSAVFGCKITRSAVPATLE